MCVCVCVCTTHPLHHRETKPLPLLQAYSVDGLSSSQLQVVQHLREFGLVYQRKVGLVVANSNNRQLHEHTHTDTHGCRHYGMLCCWVNVVPCDIGCVSEEVM